MKVRQNARKIFNVGGIGALLFVFFAFKALTATGVSQAEESSSPTVTIQTVFLQSGGQWRRVLSPDKRVDLSVEEPVVAFFNNGGRVPEGEYENFKIEFTRDSQATQVLMLRESLAEALPIKKGSFVRVSFSLDASYDYAVMGAKFIVDEEEMEFLAKDLYLGSINSTEGSAMVLVNSTMMTLKTKAPDFSLPDVTTGKKFSLQDFSEKKALLVMFVCRHCPYVQHVKEELARLGRDYASKDMALVAISSNDAEKYPDDAPASLKEFAQEEKIMYPFLYDESQKTALDYTAACTPDFFLFDDKRELVYRGQLDDSRPGNGKPVTGKDLRAAVDAVLAGKPVEAPQRPSAGCNVKWKRGQEPSYFPAS